ncbi:MAG: cyclic peptide export ABC transporter [Cytophagales bacterium]|nr:cyclic peptide export ABC transporter [Cytophagales bacterium]
MRFVFALIKHQLGKYLFATLINASAGIAAALVIKHVHSGLKDGVDDPQEFVMMFVVYILCSALLGLWGTYQLTKLSQNTLHDLRVNLSNRIMHSSFQQIELEEDKIIPIMTIEINKIGAAASKLADLFKNIAIVTVCLGYLIYLSWEMAAVAMLFFSVNFILTFIILPYTRSGEENMKELRITLFRHLRGMVNGLKELNFKKKLREEYTKQLISPTIRTLDVLKLKMGMILSTFAKIDNLIIMSAIAGGVIFLHGSDFITPKQLLEFMIWALFMMSPMNQIVRFLRSLNILRIAISLIEDLGIELTADDEIKSKPIDSSTWTYSDPIIQFQNVHHEYEQDEEHESFVLGPLDFEINSGEIVFIVGGNGSGKTTLVKILTGLYKPVNGEIIYKDHKISSEYLEAYQDAYSAIFSDAHLFKVLYHIDDPVLEAKGSEYIKLLELDAKVKIEDREFSTIKLSYGQRKRLSLVMALLEDKEIYVFDEWAANQDPYFKEIFYDQILKELKRNGKTVIVVSHDDSYFDRADKIIKLTDGQLS